MAFYLPHNERAYQDHYQKERRKMITLWVYPYHQKASISTKSIFYASCIVKEQYCVSDLSVNVENDKKYHWLLACPKDKIIFKFKALVQPTLVESKKTASVIIIEFGFNIFPANVPIYFLVFLYSAAWAWNRLSWMFFTYPCFQS